MDKEFKDWLGKNKPILAQLGLRINNYQEVDNGDGNTAITITHETDIHMGQITVRNSGSIDIEILSVESGEMVFHIYCSAKEGIDFDSLLGNYVEYMKT